MAGKALRSLHAEDEEPLFLLPPLVTRGELKSPEAEAATLGRARLQGLPRFFYSLEELQDTPFPPPEDKHQDCLSAISCACAVLVVLSLLGTGTCIVMLIFNEVLPRFCPAHHVECLRLEWPANPYFRTWLLLFFLGFIILLPMAIASCQSNCVCLMAFLHEDGWWFHCKRRTWALVRSCVSAAVELKRLRRCCCCCRRSASLARVQPGESRTAPKGLHRAFGAETGADFGNLMIVPVPPPIPKKPATPGFPRRWCHTAAPKFHEAVELNIDGEGGEVARLVLNDSTWHIPPRCERVIRLESSDAWSSYLALRRREAGREREREADGDRYGGVEHLGEELDPRANEQILFYGTTVEVAEQVQLDAQVPDTPDCPRHVLLRRLGGGAQFCDRGFWAHEQAVEAGYNKERLDAPWAVLVCRVVLGRSLVHSGQHAGPRLQREWGTGRWSSILIKRDGHREFLLPPDVRNAAYPEYVVILR